MRSELGGHVSGFGTTLAMPIHEDDNYRDKKIMGRDVKFTNEPIDGDYESLCKSMSGNITTYHVSNIKRRR